MRIVSTIALGLAAALVAACTTVEEERAELASGSDFDLCYAASDRRPLRSERRKAAASIIRERGTACDWSAAASMHAAEAAQGAALMRQGSALLAAARPVTPAPVAVTCTRFGDQVTCR